LLVFYEFFVCISEHVFEESTQPGTATAYGSGRATVSVAALFANQTAERSSEVVCEDLTGEARPAGQFDRPSGQLLFSGFDRGS
jgi:hypothetical protein